MNLTNPATITSRSCTSSPPRDARLVRKPPLPPGLFIRFLRVRLPRKPRHVGALFGREVFSFEWPEGFPGLSTCRWSNLASTKRLSVRLLNVTMGGKFRSYIVVGATESTLLVCMLNFSDFDLVVPDARTVRRTWVVNLAQASVF